MNKLMWIIFVLMLALLLLSLLWLIWKLRSFSQTQHQSLMDDKLLHSMLGDEALSKKVKKALTGQPEEKEPEEETAEEEKKGDQAVS